jgi:hypothetical protein
MLIKHLDNNTKHLEVLLYTDEKEVVLLAIEPYVFTNGTISLPECEVFATILIDEKTNINAKISIDAKIGINAEINMDPKISVNAKTNTNIMEQLLKEYKYVFAWTYKDLRSIPLHLAQIKLSLIPIYLHHIKHNIG